MNSLHKGIVVGVLQCALVLSLAGKLVYDRATCPRVWVKTLRFDPNLPIRGRYLSLLLDAEPGSQYFDRTSRHQRVVFFMPEHSADFEQRPLPPERAKSFGPKSLSRVKVRRGRFAWGLRKTALAKLCLFQASNPQCVIE